MGISLVVDEPMGGGDHRNGTGDPCEAPHGNDEHFRQLKPEQPKQDGGGNRGEGA